MSEKADKHRDLIERLHFARRFLAVHGILSDSENVKARVRLAKYETRLAKREPRTP